MSNSGGNEKALNLLSGLKAHLASLPATEPSVILPRCECMGFFRPLVVKGIVSGPGICLCCNRLTGWLNWNPKDCPFLARA